MFTTTCNKIPIASLNHEFKFPILHIFSLIISFTFNTLNIYVVSQSPLADVANFSGFVGACGVMPNIQQAPNLSMPLLRSYSDALKVING